MEAYNLPVGLRKWFVERLYRQLEAESEAIRQASKGGGPTRQELTAHNQPQVPAPMKRHAKGQS